MEQYNINIEYIQVLKKNTFLLINIMSQILLYIFAYTTNYPESSQNAFANDNFNRIIIKQRFITLVNFLSLFLIMFLLYLFNRRRYINIMTYINALIILFNGLVLCILYQVKAMFFAT